jgi:signal transduction histidine kinase
MGMKIQGHRKQVLLFLVAVLLPSLVLVALTLRIVTQERELAQKRVADEHRRINRETGQALLSRLERIKLEEAAAAAGEPRHFSRRRYLNAEVVLVARVADNHLILPWDVARPSGASSVSNRNTEFARMMRQAENQEFSAKDYSRASDLYRKSAESGATLDQEGYARLQLARALAKMKRPKESLSEYQKVLSLPPGVVDEYGVPFPLYAAEPVFQAPAGFRAVIERVGAELKTEAWLAPAGIYLARDLLEKIRDASPEVAVQKEARDALLEAQRRLEIMEQALALQADYQRLGLAPFQSTSPSRGEPPWTIYGQRPWLVSLATAAQAPGSLLVVVDAQSLFSSLRTGYDLPKDIPSGFRFVTGLTSDGLPLNPRLQGLGLAFESDASDMSSKLWSAQRSFYFLALVLVLGITLFGAYLLWRDVRREVGLADLRSQFVSSVSHELKTPLTAIRMFAETLRLGRSKDPASQVEYLDTIIKESERLTRLLNSVLDFSKIEKGKRTYHPAPVSLAEIVQAAARAMEYPLKQQGFKLEVEADEGLPEMTVDRDAIEQALLNLLSNAMKYSGESRTVGLNVGREGDCALIQVTDKGIGIDPKDQARIFEKFYRVPTRENQSLPGTGLGLALVAHIVKAHGGAVRVESAPGEGSTFSILLPLENKP